MNDGDGGGIGKNKHLFTWFLKGIQGLSRSNFIYYEALLNYKKYNFGKLIGFSVAGVNGGSPSME